MYNFLKILSFYILTKMRIVSWFVDNKFNNNLLPENLPWDIYTHIRSGQPIVDKNGFASCNLSTMPITEKIINLGKKNDVIIQWGPGIKYPDDTFNNTFLKNYYSSIKKACLDCNIGGIEIDFEYGKTILEKLGIIPYKDSNRYSNFLSKLKKAVGKNILVSADIGTWGLDMEDYIIDIWPWVNTTLLNNGDIDFVNTMSYHWSEKGLLNAWKDNIFALKYFYKYNLSKVNLGIGYFSNNYVNNSIHQQTWNSLSKKCPNIEPSLNECNNILFVGKKMNENIGKLAIENGFGGVFPWAANYDSIEYNYSLV